MMGLITSVCGQISRPQLAVRRRWLRLKLLAWEAHRLRKIYWRVWWDGLIQSPGFRLTMRRVRAGSTVAVEAVSSGLKR